MSAAIDLRTAIVALLNSGEFSRAFQAVPRYAPLTIVEMEELGTLQVSVFIGPRKAERITREDFQRTYTAIVAVQQKLAGTEAAEVQDADELQALVEEIEEALEGVDLADLSFVSFSDEQDVEYFGAEAMQAFGVYAAAIELEYTA